MLETKDLCKIYKPKKGAQVTAVDHVSVRFPEKGMVFLLGKSGSGKSTMLNLLGGLDSYDGGEIIIKGISSKDFDQQRFDSYRNTYVGFIFQEYNVLEEFTVGANIALALELQGKKASDEEINHILKEVDLDGFGDRNPNELSGGQKQRVAIARALVKNPEIIMADEPTGALDSNTGRQVLDTLKKLSADKLIVIVSHDREYAEQYADRIIELADGKIVRDVTANDKDDKSESELIFRSNTVEIPNGYHLTEEDRIRINEYIDKVRSGITMAFQDSSRNFSDTDESVIPVQDGSDFKLIKSVLPMKSAFKIGKSSLKHKKFRLVMTILLSVVAFTLFASVDTFGSYNHIRTCVDSLIDSDIGYVSLSKSVKSGVGKLSFWASPDNSLTDEDIVQIKSDTGIDTVGIFKPRLKNLGFWKNFNSEEIQDGMANTLSSFGGFAEITEETLKSMGYSVYAGKLPDGSKKEIAISRMAAETFIKAGYKAAKPEKTDTGRYLTTDDTEASSSKNVKYEKFSDPLYMVGKTLLIDNELYTVTAVIDTNFDSSRYDILSDESANGLVKMLLSEEYERVINYSLTGVAMVGTGAVEKMIKEEPAIYEPEKGSVFFDSYGNDKSANIWSSYVTRISDVSADDIVWLDKPVDTLAENEIIISADCITCFVKDRQKNILPEDGIVTSEVIKTINDFITEAGGMEAQIYQFTAFSGDDKVENIKIVGMFSENSVYGNETIIILPDTISEKIIDFRDGVYNCVVGAMPDNRTDIDSMVRYCYRDGDDVTERYNLNNAVTYELDTVNTVLKTMSKIFLGLGIFFALFASVLMANFISISINYKKSEIGILRAIGSRSNDVFRIFFSESFIIAVIEFALTVIITFVGVLIVNSVMRNEVGILVTLLHFGIRQILLILLLCVAVAAIASFIPVMKIASRKPIDAIRNR